MTRSATTATTTNLKSMIFLTLILCHFFQFTSTDVSSLTFSCTEKIISYCLCQNIHSFIGVFINND